MRHNRDEKRFDRTAGHLRCMLSNMTNDLVLAGRIKTTTQRAKVLRRYAERMITLGKDGSLASRRRAFAFMRNKNAVTKLFDEVAPRYTERNGGYTRILKLGARPGDNASMSIIELVEGKEVKVEAKPPKAPKKAKPKAEPKAKAAPKEKKAAKAVNAKEKKAEPKTKKKAEAKTKA